VSEPHSVRVPVGELPEGVQEGDHPLEAGGERTRPVRQRGRTVHGGNQDYPNQQRLTLRRRTDGGERWQ